MRINSLDKASFTENSKLVYAILGIICGFLLSWVLKASMIFGVSIASLIWKYKLWVLGAIVAFIILKRIWRKPEPYGYPPR